MKRTDIINALIQKYGYKSYLEVGTQDPTSNFDLINAECKVSIDPFPRGEVTFVGTSDEYFESIDDNVKFDIILDDSEHKINSYMPYYHTPIINSENIYENVDIEVIYILAWTYSKSIIFKHKISKHVYS